MTDEESKNVVIHNQFLSVYKKDFIERKFEKCEPYTQPQEFQDPISEGFKNYLRVDETHIEKPLEDGDVYLNKVKDVKPKIGRMYFDKPLDHITIKGAKILEGRTQYEVDYCDVEKEIRRRLMEKQQEKPKLPEGWVIPITTQNSDFRDPRILCRELDRPLVIKPMDNLGQDEKMNRILKVRTGDSEYNRAIGNLGQFIVENQMHGKIVHPKC